LSGKRSDGLAVKKSGDSSVKKSSSSKKIFKEDADEDENKAGSTQIKFKGQQHQNASLIRRTQDRDSFF
jgi:hypothetical protein